ncbi:MAG: tRNA (adenosine(37)-N6)-threonylcarbamoyltransferase complex ATPase subunit type 1 TsaE [Clostridium sp.]|uniref:tRNA (adenosine(37)-N6)-threonylcarbamoyltransferase complex ATPase subunit type 1 TsaE n=1 Tax=Clostridium sp. TaxID=1506 RepID=UPI002FC8E0E3
MIYNTSSENETIELGKKIGQNLKRGDILTLNGDLGAGKTHFTKGIAMGLNVDDYVTSPTFTIVNEYRGDINLYHFDVYRIEYIEQMYDIGFDEYLFGDGICIIEWSDIVKELLPENTIDIVIKKLDDNNREIEITGASFAL